MKIIVILMISVLLMGCSSSRYMIADRYMSENNLQGALDEYIRIAELDGSIAISRDVRALTGAMIAYYNLQNYKNSLAVSKRILSLQKYNSCAIFYAGMNLEQLDKQSLAKKVLRFYTVLSRVDPYYKLIKAKFDQFAQEEMQQRAQRAIKMENNISPDQMEDGTIGVLYFLNVAEDSSWNVLSKGLAEMMITDLSQVKSLKVLERVYLEKLVEEMQLGLSGLADEKTAPRLGRLMKAKNLINGSFMISAGQNLTINSTLLDVVSNHGLQSKEFAGLLDDIFKVEKEIVFAVIEQMGIRLTPEERQKISKYATRNFNAFLAYCNGLDSYDLAKYQEASAYFREAIKLDPNFMLAREMFEMTDALEIIQQEKFSSLYLDYISPKSVSVTKVTSLNLTRNRLDQISQNLDLSYLPGNDSRNGVSDLMYYDHNWQRIGGPLPSPPLPPLIPPNQ